MLTSNVADLAVPGRRPMGRRIALLVLLAWFEATAAHAASYAYSAAGTILSVIDEADPSIVARIPLGSDATGGVAAGSSGARIYASTFSHIAAVDAASRSVVATIPVGGASRLFTLPASPFLYAAGRITLPGAIARPMVAVIDTRSATMMTTVALPSPSSVAGMVALPQGTRIYVANAMAGCCSGSVSVIDTATHTLIAEIPLVVRGGLVVDPSGASVYAVTSTGVAIIDTATNGVASTITVDGTAAAVAVDPAGATLYVATYQTIPGSFGGRDGRVLAIDPRTQAVLATVPLGLTPTALTIDPARPRLYVAGTATPSSGCARPTCVLPGGVAVIDTDVRSTPRAVIATFPPASTASYVPGQDSLVVDPSGAAVYATYATVLSVISPTTLSVTGTLPAIAPLAFAASTTYPGSLYYYTLTSRSGAFTATQWGAPGDRAVPADYDGDGRADVAVFRPREGTQEGLWYAIRSSDGGVIRRQWGSVTLGDVPVPADYDGDGRADFAVWRPADSEWFILRSSDGGTTYWPFGHSGDVPVPADYDGDARADLATYNAGTWLIFGSASGVTSRQLGEATDVPVPGDYDGDGRTDAAVFRPRSGDWLVLETASGTVKTTQWGAGGDVAVPADYDGDGKTDLAVWRPADGSWWIRSSRTGEVLRTTWGAAGDRPVSADYDGDHRADVSVYRP